MRPSLSRCRARVPSNTPTPCSAYDKAAIMFRGWDAETNAPSEVRACSAWKAHGSEGLPNAGSFPSHCVTETYIFPSAVLPRRRVAGLAYAEGHHGGVCAVAAPRMQGAHVACDAQAGRWPRSCHGLPDADQPAQDIAHLGAVRSLLLQLQPGCTLRWLTRPLQQLAQRQERSRQERVSCCSCRGERGVVWHRHPAEHPADGVPRVARWEL